MKVVGMEGETARELFGRLGSVRRGFDVDAYLASEMGSWAASQLADQLAGVDQAAPSVILRWRALGMEKRYFPGDDQVKEWSVFVPVGAEVDKLLPALFAMHMGGTSVFYAETMGFVEDAARRGYVVVCPSWSADGLTASQEAAWRESGLAHYESYAFRSVLERAREIAPIDPTRVYCAGFSGGGNACGYVAMDCPRLVAGISSATGAAIQVTGDGLGQLAEVGCGMMMVYGTLDAEERWPIVGDPVELGPVHTYLSPRERLANVNVWVHACGAVTETGIGDIASIARDGVGTAAGDFGFDFDAMSDMRYEARYSTGDLLDARGRPRVRFMSVEGCPHYVSPRWAAETYGFLSRFSRDTQTGELLIDE